MPNRDQQGSTEHAFVRSLPGGGFVAIDISVDTSLWRRSVYHGSISVERRTNHRMTEHAPPVVARASGPSAKSVLLQLLPTAQSNVAIASALCELERHGTRYCEPQIR